MLIQRANYIIMEVLLILNSTMAHKHQLIRHEVFDSDNESELNFSWQTGEVGWVGIIESKDDLKESCDICGKQMEDLGKHKHMAVNHEKEVKCQLCSKTFLKGNLRLHILKDHWRNEMAKCTLCEKKFENLNAMKSHVKKTHINELTTCNICHKDYKNLQDHIKFFHEKFKTLECSYCKIFFNQRDV